MHSMRSNKVLEVVREIGFDQSMGPDHFEEELFFLGPQMRDGREEGAQATLEAIREFIEYWENQIQVAKDYLENGCNNRTHEWRTPPPVRPDTSGPRRKSEATPASAKAADPEPR